MSPASDTPRTDTYAGYWATCRVNGKTIFEHAQDLERELAAERADVVILKQALCDAAATIAADGKALSVMAAAKNRALEALKQQHWALVNARRGALQSDNPRCFVTEHDSTGCPTCKLISELEGV